MLPTSVVTAAVNWVTFNATANNVSHADSKDIWPKIAVGKWEGNASSGASASPETVLSPHFTVVAAAQSSTTTLRDRIEDFPTDIMLDSGASISLIREDLATQLRGSQPVSKTCVQVVSATGEAIQVLGSAMFYVHVGPVRVQHSLVVVKSLITPVILGIDFLQDHGLILDFSTTPIKVTQHTTGTVVQEIGENEKSALLAAWKTKAKVCAITECYDLSEESLDECAIPLFGNPITYDVPTDIRVQFSSIVEEHCNLFRELPGHTSLMEHHIPTNGPPAKVPPRRIAANYRTEVEQQLRTMLEMGIIEESSSPWMAPMVLIPKKSGELRLCVDYRELNMRTVKDAYPLPCPDEAQDRLAGSSVFSTLDLQNGYWQIPVTEEDRPKTAFCPGPGLGLHQFRRMPFGLTGAPSSFQHLMDTVCHRLPFITTYLDDVLVHSSTDEEHQRHLKEIFHRLEKAGLFLQGNKYCIGTTHVTYLGHVFSDKGMERDPSKVSAVKNWITPTNVTSLRSFLGLASYYRRYIHQFADIAAPLHHLTSKGVPFQWDTLCQSAFEQLKLELTKAPILSFPDFSPTSQPFQLQTDASSIGVGAVLEQDGHVIAYASRVLSTSERNYSVIQRECLAIVFALKQFRHYLLGRPFTLYTDHAPLQWLSAQKTEGLLARWTLAMQEFTFTIQYRKGADNGNADSLSRKFTLCQQLQMAAATTHMPDLDHLQQHQEKDPIIIKIRNSLQSSNSRPTSGEWNSTPLSRYRQLWSQLLLEKGIVFRRYAPGPTSVLVTVPLVPSSLQSTFLQLCHDAPQAGHLGVEKTASLLRQKGYWVGMLSDVEQHCRACIKCQQCRPTLPTRAPLTTIPIGCSWEMVAVDILQLPPSCQRNKYLFVIQDYLMKWAKAIPIPDQTADRITWELINIFTRFGLPRILHSDQGANFEITLLQQTLVAFGVHKSRTTSYHP